MTLSDTLLDDAFLARESFLRRIPKVELHCHTRVSKDSLMSYDAIIKRVRERGLDAIAITDHNKIDGAFALAKRAPFPVIIGEEIRTSEGEIIGYFLNALIPRGLPPEDAKKLMLQAFIAEAFSGAADEENLQALAPREGASILPEQEPMVSLAWNPRGWNSSSIAG